MEAKTGKKAGLDGKKKLAGLAEASTNIVARAASILEEQIAVGIVAAKNVESRFVDVQAIRQGKPDEVILRFRRDAHEVVDILIDLLTVATNTIGGLTRGSVKIGDFSAKLGGAAPETPDSGSVPTVSPAGPTRPGASAGMAMSLENDGDAPTEEFHFHVTDLVSPSGGRITAHHVTFSPDSLTIAAHDKALLTITVAVPEDAPAGVYTGLLQATKLSRLRAMILVQVA